MKVNLSLALILLLTPPRLSPAEAQLLCQLIPYLCTSESPSAAPSLSSQPSFSPSQHPSQTPTKSLRPSQHPSDSPSLKPTHTPSGSPSNTPSKEHSTEPSVHASNSPSEKPSVYHSSLPSIFPSIHPSMSPTKSSSPSDAPTSLPSESPLPSSQPSQHPSMSSSPSNSPTESPTKSAHPSFSPTVHHSDEPSTPPTDRPTLSAGPSESPTTQPTDKPTTSPSESPSHKPTTSPSDAPTRKPSTSPTHAPTTSPSESPTHKPSTSPTDAPTETPSEPASDFPSSAPSHGPRPNLIMVLTDEHNLRTLGCYRKVFIEENQPEQAYVWGDGIEVETPHIDRLAAEGALFTNFHTVAPLCTPSRASFMSGLYPQRTGAQLNHGRMNDDIVTFAEVLETKRGYHTGYGGKWHLNGEDKPGWSDTESDLRRFGFTNSTYLWNRGHWKFLDHQKGEERKVFEFWEQFKFKGKEEENFTTDFLFDKAIEFMKGAKERNEPFAYIMSIPDPHAPNEVRQPYEDMYKHFQFQLPKSAKKAVRMNPSTPTWNYNEHEGVSLDDAEGYLRDYERDIRYQNHLQQYFGMVKCIDDNMGKLLEFLSDEGLEEETIVIFTADHGDLLGEHGKMNKGRPFRTSAGVPFILRFPGKVLEGKRIDSVLTSVDFAPSILSLMGVENYGVEFDGNDFSNEVLSKYPRTNYPRTRFAFDTNDSPQWAAVMKRELKLVVARNDIPFLFDLKVDPYEVENFFDVPKYQVSRDVLIESLIDAMEKYDLPIKDSPFMYLSTPSCRDSSDRIQIDSVNYLCIDVGDSLPIEQCTSNQALRQHCAVSCNSCCEDSPGEIWAKGQRRSCAKLKGFCNNYKVQNFCPSTCGQCSSGRTIFK